ncbi:MAG: hypothetical protein ACK4UN_19750, partial [Limisphaerales bacterium]
MKSLAVLLAAVCCLVLTNSAFGFREPDRPVLPNFDKRQQRQADLPQEKKNAVGKLKQRLPQARIDFDEIVGAPRHIHGGDRFLTGPNAQGGAVPPTATQSFANDPHRATKAFLKEHRGLFGHGAEALEKARVTREFAGDHNKLKTVVWQQEHEGIPVFEAVLISHTTDHEELVSVSSQFVPDPMKSAKAGGPNSSQPKLKVEQAIAAAAENVGEILSPADVEAITQSKGDERKQKFKAKRLLDETDTRLVWLPTSEDQMQLCWEIILTAAARSEMFRLLVDTQTGEVLVRQCLTEYISDATYRVYTSD